MLVVQDMDADTVGAAALQLLARLAAQGAGEVQEQRAADVLPSLHWRGGRRAMLLEDQSLSSGTTAVYIIVSVRR